MSDREYWDAYARAFDAIYSHKKSRIGAWLDLKFRKDMYERFALALAGAEPIKGRTFLDVGCGSGVYVKALAERGPARVVGLDFSPEMLALAKQNVATGAGLRNAAPGDVAAGFSLRDERNLKVEATNPAASPAVEFVCGDFMEYEPGETFDIVLGMGFMDYTPDPLPVLKKMRALAKDKVLLSFPRAGTWRAAARNLRMKLRSGRKLRACRVYFYSGARIARLMSEAGFKDCRRGRVGQLYFVEGQS